jgi:two-component system sensor histidine kinase CpxA
MSFRTTMNFFTNLAIAQRLFLYLSCIFLILFTLSTTIESMLLDDLLTLPDELQMEFKKLADEAERYVSINDKSGLEKWEKAQKYTLYVVDAKNQSITNREIHPHVKLKMSFSHQVNKPMNNKVSKPMITMHLSSGLHLMLQLPWQLHPADRAKYYLWTVRLSVASIFLALISWIFSRHLQRPLKHLQSLSHQLASGNLSVRSPKKLNSNIKEFNDLADDFDHMAGQIEKLVLSHKKLLRNISHELRTPLTRQNLAIHLLRNRLQPEQVKYFLQIEDDAKEMNNLIQQILGFSRLESRSYPVKLYQTKLIPVVRKVINESVMQAKSAQKIIFLAPKSDAAALIESDLLARVLRNAINNSLKYAGEQCKIIINITQESPYVVIEISDNGPGLAEDDLLRIFEPFYRASNDVTAGIEGYGLGMAIMKSSVEQMNGRITAESVLGEGLTIRCYLSTPKISKEGI